MAVPALAKTWQHSVNRVVLAQGNIYRSKMMTMKSIKDGLVAMPSNGWDVIGSSDARVDTGSVNAGAAGMDAVDRWTSVASFAGSDGLGQPSAGRFPWIVLQQAGLGGGTGQLCISCGNNGNTGVMNAIVWSPGAGFTGGSVGARPTATDEVISAHTTGNPTAHSGIDMTHHIDLFQSTDGKCTRIWSWAGGQNNCLWMLVDEPLETPTGWTNPSVFFANGIAPGLACAYATLLGANAKGKSTGAASTVTMAMNMTGETDASTGSRVLAQIQDVGSQKNDFSGEWPFFPVGVSCKTASARGRHGTLADLYWKPMGLNSGQAAPPNCEAQEFMCLGDLIHPWTGDGTVALF